MQHELIEAHAEAAAEKESFNLVLAPEWRGVFQPQLKAAQEAHAGLSKMQVKFGTAKGLCM